MAHQSDHKSIGDLEAKLPNPRKGYTVKVAFGDEPDHVLLRVEGRLAHITLNRPERLNAISEFLPRQLRRAVELANEDDTVHVIILSGSGRAFCSGYDLKDFAESTGARNGHQKMPWDPLLDYQFMGKNTEDFMSLWRSLKPIVCKIKGFAIAGGSDIALCSDVIVMAEDAKIGYPPSVLWGCPTTFMWVYRLGIEKAKRLLLTGDTIDGKEAYRIGLISHCVPESQVDECTESLALRMARAPKNQLAMQKLVINKAYSNMGMESTQALATLLDGISRHTPEGVAFKRRAEKVGFKQAVIERDGGQEIWDHRSDLLPSPASATSSSSQTTSLSSTFLPQIQQARL